MTEGDAEGRTPRDEASSRPPSPPWRLLIADDHALVREGMRTLLATEPDLAVVGEAKNGLEAVELSRSLSPDLVLMDVRMPEMDGLAAARRIRRECPKTSVLMVTSHESPDYLLKAVRAGAAGYVLKEATKQQLANAVRRALEGESPLNQELAMQLLRRLSSRERDDRKAKRRPAPPDKRQEEGALPEPLTDRELEILRLLALGKTNREVSRELWLSLSTVKRHVEHIIAKLGGSDRTRAAVRAVELGLLPRQEEEKG